MIYLRRRKRALKRAIVFLCLVITMGVLYLVFDKLSFAFLSFSPSITIFIALNALIAVCLYKPLDKLILRTFKVYIFPRALRPMIRLLKMARELPGVLALNELGNIIVNTLVDLFNFENATLFIHDKARGGFVVRATCGRSLAEAKKSCLGEHSALVEKLRVAHHPVVAGSLLQNLAWWEASSLRRAFEETRSTIMLPLRLNGELIGCIGMKQGSSKKTFSLTELRVFMEFASIVSQAAHNAVAFDELRLENKKLRDVQSRVIQDSKRLAIEHLASGIAHEIHNPLTVISGKAQVLLLNKDKPQFRERSEEVLKTIVRQTQRAADVTKRLLMFTRSLGNNGWEEIDFNGVIKNTVALISYQASVDEIEIKWHVEENLPPLKGNVREFQEIFLDLILNSVQSVRQKGRIDIDIRYSQSERLIKISVQDTGCGISEEDISQIFDPFYGKKNGAMGMGLYIVQQIVNRYGGTIRVDSSIGSGSVFLIEFPVLNSVELPGVSNVVRESKDVYRLVPHQYKQQIKVGAAEG